MLKLNLIILRDLSKFGVDNIVVSLGLVARVSVLRVTAGQSFLAEDSLVTAEEGVLSCLNDGASVVFDGKAHVENFAAVGYVSIVTVRAAFAREGLGRLPSEDLEVPVGECVGRLC